MAKYGVFETVKTLESTKVKGGKRAMGKIEDLEKLQRLKESGAITQIEFEVEKAKILNDVSNLSTNQEKVTTNGKKSPLSIASLACGIVSIFVFPYIFGIGAVILGIIGLANLEEKKNLAIAGIIVGIIGILWAFFAYGIL